MDNRMTARVKHGVADLAKNRERLERIDRYTRGRHDPPFLPKKANPEFYSLADRAITNLLPLIVDAPVNAMSVKGYQRSGISGVPAEWKHWTRNRLDERQSHIHRAALEAGHAYVTVIPSPAGPMVQGHHPVSFFAAYRNPGYDEFPLYALRVDKVAHGEPKTATYYDDSAVCELEFSEDEDRFTVVDVVEHDFAVTPVVRFASQLDLQGDSMGLVEPIMPLQDKLNQIQLNQLIAQHYTSFAIRWATGLAPMPALDVNGNEQYDEAGQLKVIPPVIDPSTMLMSADPATKFGSLEGSSTKDIQESAEQCIRHMCMVTQTPPHYLLGQMANLSADALAAAESAFIRKISEIQSNFGEAWANVLRLCALASGNAKGFADKDSVVTWADKSNRSLAQAADAFAKFAGGGMPPEIAMRFIPGLSESDIEEAVKLMEEQREEMQLVNKLAAAMSPAPKEVE